MFEKIYLLEIFRKNMSLLKKFLWKLWVPILQFSWHFSAKSPFLPQNSEKLPPAPHSEKNYQTEHFSRNKIFPGEVYLDR